MRVFVYFAEHLHNSSVLKCFAENRYEICNCRPNLAKDFCTKFDALNYFVYGEFLYYSENVGFGELSFFYEIFFSKDASILDLVIFYIFDIYIFFTFKNERFFTRSSTV